MFSPQIAVVCAGGLKQPPVVPQFLESLKAAGANPTRVDAYTTKQGVSPDDIGPEAALMDAGCVSAVVFTSTAEAQGLVNALGGVDVLQRLVADKGMCDKRRLPC
jgi:uroporphyrinogen-III synthase